MSTIAWEPLLRRNRELASFLAESPGGLHWLDVQGRILWASDGVLELLGYDAASYTGRALADFVASDDR